MPGTTYLERSNCYPLTNLPITENLVIELTHEDLTCPYCGATGSDVSTWGSYLTEAGEIRRYNCYLCTKTWNPAKIPYIYERMSKVLFSIAKMVIKNRVSVNKLAKDLGVPKSTLNAIISEIEAQLASNFEHIKAVDLALSPKLEPFREVPKAIFYDEGFHRLLGGQYYLVFAINAEGEVIQADLTPSRDNETVYACLEQAVNKMGGVDFIVSDGAPAVLNSVKNLKRSVILVQQIHSNKGKRARIIKIDPILGKKSLRQLTVELNTESLKFGREAIIRTNERIVYPRKAEKKLAHQTDPSIKKNEEINTQRPDEYSNTGRSNKKVKAKEEDPFDTVNWICTPDTNF